MSRPLAAGLLAVALALPATARADTARFFFRGALGPGYGGSFTTGAGPAITIRGGGMLGNFAVGLNLGRGFAVHVDACAMALVSPTVVTNGTERVSPLGADTTTTLSIIGAGVTWRHPSQFWASLSGGVAVIGVEVPGGTCFDAATMRRFDCSYGLTELGGGVNLLVGRDWPLTYAWHIGVALHAIAAAVPDRPAGGVQPLWITLGGGASLVITAQ